MRINPVSINFVTPPPELILWLGFTQPELPLRGGGAVELLNDSFLSYISICPFEPSKK